MNQACEMIRVRGQVQGVGFRPTVSRIATLLALPGWVKNDADGVLIALGGDASLRDRFVKALLENLPPLARVQELVRESVDEAVEATLPDGGFRILSSDVARDRSPTAQALPDASVCAACSAEVLDAQARRYRYPFTNCTHCGPRFSIMLALPWDRTRTSMAGFEMCEDCRAEYNAAHDRRYHAEPIACPKCGPRVQVARARTRTHTDAQPFSIQTQDAMDAVADLLMQGEIVALKGLGGYHLLADATQAETVARLRSLKRRAHKPFALMARDVELVNAYCFITPLERASLLDSSAPIVLLRARTPAPSPALAASVYPLPPLAAAHHGFMLPMTPLHLLALQRMPRPVVCTSGNRSEEPQVIDDAEASERLGDIADWIVSHDRPIHNRVDDSVVRVFGGRQRVLRRARGLAPAPVALPPGFEQVAAQEAVWAAGGDLKAAVCLSRKHDLLLSQHLGDLDDARGYVEYEEQCQRLSALFAHRPTRVALDNHPDSRAGAHAQRRALELGVPAHAVAHHHAHFAACLGDNGVALDGRARIGLVLDGIGQGDSTDSTSALWGCEVLVGDYAQVQRVGTLLPTALLGGDRAAREPWRCLYAQLRAAFSWQTLAAEHGELECVQRLSHKPIHLLEQLLERGIAAPCASSCGRLFDAVAAALGICFEQQSFEAQAAQTLEALIDDETLAQAVAERAAGNVYVLPIHTCPRTSLRQLDPRALWPKLLADLARQTPIPLLAARFHVAFAAALAQLCAEVAAEMATPERVVALSGGCLQNAVLHERLRAELATLELDVLAHRDIPANDGGIAVGQALVTLARCAQNEPRT